MELRFELKGYLELTADVEGLLEDISEVVREANQAFRRGVPEEEAGEAAVIVEYGGEDRRLRVRIISGGRVRAHDALLRFKNLLTERLGPSKRVGVRDVVAERISARLIGGHVGAEEAKRKLKGIAEVRAEGETLILEFRNLTDHDIRDRVIDRAIRLVKVEKRPAEKPEAEKLAPFGAILKQGPEKPFRFGGEIASEAERLGWAKRYPGRGQWIFSAPMATLLRALMSLVIDYVARPLGFREWMFPRLMPMEVFRKLSTYVEHLPEGLFYVCAPPRDPTVFEDFKREYALRREIRRDLLKKILEEPGYVLEAVQCPPFYQFFSGEIVRVEDLPVKAFDVLGGWTWRNEGGGVEGLVRTNEFWRMEMVFLGTPEDVTEIRNKVTNLTVELVDKVLDMEWRIVAGAPFFLSPEEASKRLIDVSDINKIPTLDVEVYLPYRGSRKEAEWLEISAASVHRDFYVKAFKIKEVKGRAIWTGCVGHGLTRWVAGFLARHGFNFEDWPQEVKRRIGEFPEPPKTVT